MSALTDCEKYLIDGAVYTVVDRAHERWDNMVYCKAFTCFILKTEYVYKNHTEVDEKRIPIEDCLLCVRRGPRIVKGQK